MSNRLPAAERMIIKSHRYEYYLEFIDSYADTLRRVLREKDFIIIDSRIMDLYSEASQFVKSHGHVIVESSENAKSFESLSPIMNEIVSYNFTKTDRLVALGGGVVQDITGFIASILFRGTDWLFFPTNLLTDCDSCIGSKTSINFGSYKNQLGSFFPAKEIFIDLAFIDTLPEKELRSGLGEMLHYFLISGRTDFEWAREKIMGVRPYNRNILRQLIQRSLKIKKNVIELDEFDLGPRNLFNYGHSFAHALESATNFKIPHGIAVAYGMDLSNIFSSGMKYIPLSLRNEIRSVLSLIWENSPVSDFNCQRFIEALARDKKNEGDKINVILTRGLGNMFKTKIILDSKTTELIINYFKDELWRKDL